MFSKQLKDLISFTLILLFTFSSLYVSAEQYDEGGNQQVRVINDGSSQAVPVDGSSFTQPVSGTFWQATQPVSGTVTETNSSSLLTSAQLLDDVVATIAAAFPSKAYAIAGTDGTNARGIKTDSNGELQVDVLTMPTITITDGSGALNVILDSGTLTSITNPVAVTGTFWQATQPVSGTVTVTDGAGALNTIVDSGTLTAVTSITNPVAVTQSGTWDEVGINDSGNSITVDGTVTANAGSGTFTTSGVVTQVTPGTGATDLGKAEDALHASGDTGVLGLTVRSDSNAALAGNGDNAPLQTDSVGLLKVTIPVNTVTFARLEDNTSANADPGVSILTVRRDTAASSAGTDGDYATVNTDANGNLWVNGSGVTQPVSAASLPLPSGAATAANQTTMIGHVDGVEGLLTTIDADTGTIAGAVSGTEMQVDVVTLPNVTIGTSLPAGTNAIGKLSANDGVDIGDVTINNTAAAAVNTKLVDAAGDSAMDGTNDAVRVNVVAGGAGDGAILDGVSSSIKATVVDYTNSNPLTVRLTDTNGDYVAAGAGTQYTEDAAAAGDPVGSALMMVRDDALSGQTTADGDNVAARGTDKGELYVKHVDSIPVTDNGGALTVDNGGTFAVQAAQSGTWTVQPGNTANTTPWLTSIHDGTTKASVLDLTNSNPLTTAIVDSNGDQISSFGGGTQYTEGDTDASITGTAMLWEDGSDVLRAVSAAKPLPVDITDTTVAVTQSGTWDEVGINDSGNSITVDGTVTVTDGAGALNVIVDSSALPSGASTSANQTTIIGHVDGIESLIGTTNTNTGAIQTAVELIDDVVDTANTTLPGTVKGLIIAGSDGTNTQAISTNADGEIGIQDGGNSITVDGTVTVTDGAGALNVIVDSSALPSGAATAANQTTIIGHVDGVEGLLTTIDADTGTIAGAVSGTEMQVDVLTLPAIPTGTNTIGSVKLTDGTDVADILDLTNSNPLTVGIVDGNGDQITSFGGGTQYTEDAAAAANPVGTMLMGVRADALAGKTTTDGDNVAVSVTDKGEIYVKQTDAVPVTQSGTWDEVGINDSGNSITVDGTVTVTDGAGALNVIVDSGAITETNSGGIQTSVQLIDDTVATTAAAITSKGMAAAGTDGTNARILKTDTSGELQIDVLTMPTTTVTDGAGALNVIVDSGAITETNSGGIQTAVQLIDDTIKVDDAAFTPAVTSVNMAGFEYDDTTPDSVNEGDAGAARMSANRNVYTTIRDAAGNERGANVDASGNLSVAVGTALPAGTNAIGKLAANSGVDIGDVDVTSVTPGTAAGNLGKAEDVGHSTGDTGVMALAVRTDTLAAKAGTDADYIPLTTNADGALWATLSANTNGGATVTKTISAASTNATNVKGSAGTLYMATASNTNASARYLKLYNKATSPTVGTDTPVLVFLIPGNTAGTGTNIPIPACGLNFGTGIGFALTTGAADSDTGAVAANEIIVNLAYK